MDIKFLTQENEIQKLYSKLGMVVPVGDLSTGKAPAIQPLPAQATQTSVTFNFNVMSGADITAIEYKVNDGEAVSVTPQKGVVTVELSDLEYNSGPYEIELTVTNETGDTSVTQTADLVPYTDWATANEVLEGNKFIGEDGQEAVGTYVAPEPVLITLNATENRTYSPEEGIDGYSEVIVNVPTGPTDGGAVVTSANLIDDGGYEIHVTFSTMPELDTVNHVYTGMLLAYCNGNYGSVFNGVSTYQNITGEVTSFNIDSVNSEISFFDVLPPQDSDGNDLSEANGYILIFEDGYDNLKYKIPCTIVNTTIV